MKILKVFGIVVGIHVLALVMIFANPGCSSSSKPAPTPTETVAKAELPPPAPITVPNTAAPVEPLFNPDAPAVAAPSSGSRYSPTRPNTPAASALVAEPVKDVTPMTTYTVGSNDSLWSIAKKNNITYQELATANNLKTSAVLKPGQKLIIPGKSPHPAPAAASKTVAAPGTAPKSGGTTAKVVPASGAQMRHTVQSGETLGTIAQLYGIKQRELAIANNITDPLKLPAGKELVIPGWDATTPPPSKTTKSSAPKTTADPGSFAPPASAPVAPVITAQPTTPPIEAPVLRVEEVKKP